MKRTILGTLATLVLLLAADRHASAAVLYTFSSGNTSLPSSDFSFIVDDMLTTTTTLGTNDLFDVVNYLHSGPLGIVGFSEPQMNPVVFLIYPDVGLAVLYIEWPGPFTHFGSYVHSTGATLRISRVQMPETGSLALFGLGLAGLGVTRRLQPSSLTHRARDSAGKGRRCCIRSVASTSRSA
jgi:hypothetical protein